MGMGTFRGHSAPRGYASRKPWADSDYIWSITFFSSRILCWIFFGEILLASTAHI